MFQKIDGFSARCHLVKAFLLIFIFLQPFGGLTSVRETAFVAMCVLFVIRAIAGNVKIDFKDSTVRALGLLAAIALLSSALSPYPLDSFNAMRKNLFYQITAFLVIADSFKDADDLRPLIYTMIGSFAALTALILIRNDISVLLDWHRHTSDKETHLAGYSLYATFYMPMTAAYLFAAKPGLRMKIFLLTCLGVELALVFLNNHRTQLVAVAASAVLIIVLASRVRTAAIVVAALLLSGLVVYKAAPALFDRYGTLAEYDTYVTNAGLTDRLSIWQGTLDIIKERPVVGYGYGWKKLAWAARDGGFMEKWDKNDRTHLYFSQFGYGAANPHNLALQLLFEVGALGLAAFVIFWSTVIIKAVATRRRDGREALLLRYAAAGVLLSYILVNTTGGLWEESMGNLMVSFAAICLVLFKAAADGKTGAEKHG